MNRKLTQNQLALHWGVTSATIRNWNRIGVGTQDARAIAAHIFAAKRRPAGWEGVFGAVGGESLDDLKKRRLRADSERLELMAARARGEVVTVESCRRIGTAMGTAFRSGLASLVGMLPEHLAGLDHAAIHEALGTAFHGLLSELGDVESGLWQEALSEAGCITPDD